jgi:hypothetical protein
MKDIIENLKKGLCKSEQTQMFMFMFDVYFKGIQLCEPVLRMRYPVPF